jgi:hypothetical protein
MLASGFNIQQIKAETTLSTELETFGDGIAKWTMEVCYSGSYSVKLLIPEGASDSSWAIVKVPYGEPLGKLEQFSFYVKYVAARPRFAVYLDKNRDGKVDSLLLSDYLDFSNGEWIIGRGGLRWGWTEATYPPYQYGDVWQPYSYWHDLYKDAIALYVATALEYWAAGPEGIGEPLYVDTVTINAMTYDLEPKILPVPYFNQGDEPWGSQQYDYTTQTIGNIGCALTCAAMILRYYGVEKSPTGETTDPSVLNERLKANNGYVMGGYIKWPSVAVYSKDANKKFGTPIIKWVGFGSRNDFTMLNNELYNNRPVILQVNDTKYGGHFVVAKGIIGSTYSINDPGWRSRTTLEAYANQFEGMLLYAPTSTDLSAIYIATQSPTQLFLIDSLGRRVGEDPITGVIYNEIPNSYYFHEALSNLPEIRVLAIINPPTDNFTIIAFGYTNEYSISFSGYDKDGNISIQDFHGLIPQYILSYSPEPGSQIHVSQAVKIDVKPGSEPNSINPTNQGVIPVAILTTETFDASTIDSNTVEFGRGKAKPIKTAFEDIDNDGDLDLVLYFRTQQVKIEKEDTQIFLTGKTKDGISIIGWDSIRVVP